MARERGFYAVLSILILGGVAVLPGEIEQDVSFSSVLEIWGDILRDVDQFGLKLTRVSDREEMQVGKDISGMVSARERQDTHSAKYVSAVGQALVPHVKRTGIQYEFHVIEAGWMVNAFALPGGQIYVTTGMLEFLRSEAELAAILGHEISHVDLRHCIEHYQYELTLKKVGARPVGQLAEIARRLVALEYGKYQELEADAHGMRLSILAGYNPEAGPAVFDRLKRHFREKAAPKVKTPVGEILQALGDVAESYFRSHPPSAERMRRLDGLVAKNRERLAGKLFYVGVENYRQRIPRSQKEIPSEQRRLYSSLRAAAEQGDADAQFSLGMMYLEGEGVPQDRAEALRWLRESAERGHASAQYSLGLMYERGVSVPQDSVEAINWYTKAAAQDYPGAQESIARITESLGSSDR
jgi:predicted Zn-dependent protease